MSEPNLLSDTAPVGRRGSEEKGRCSPGRLRSRALRLVRSDRGAVLVEFGLVAPIMALMTCAAIDFSMAMFTLNNLTIAVREGGRLAAVLPTVSTNDAAVVNRVKSSIVLNGASTAYTVAVTPDNPGATPVGNITVEINNYPYNPITPMASLFGMRTIQMNRRAVFRSEMSNN